jgi:hypothetical protein
VDGSISKEAQGFGGNLCRKAMAPYLRRQGALDGHDTAEAVEPSFLEKRVENQQQI